MNGKTTLLVVAGLMLAACAGGGPQPLRTAGVVDGDVVTLRARVAARLDGVAVSEGEAVSAGQVLARLDARDVDTRMEGEELRRREIAEQRRRLEARRGQLAAARDYAVRTSQRFERLRKKSAISGDQLEQARLRRIEAETALTDIRRQLAILDVQEAASRNRSRSLELLLEDHRLTAPAAGVVLDVHALQGENLFPGNPVLEVLDIHSLFVEVFVEEAELGRLRLNQAARIYVDGRDRPVEGRVSYFGRRAEFSPKYILSESERRNLLVQVKVSIPAADAAAVKLGMPVTVEFARPQS